MQCVVCGHCCLAFILFVNSNSGTWYLNWMRSRCDAHHWINVLPFAFNFDRSNEMLGVNSVDFVWTVSHEDWKSQIQIHWWHFKVTWSLWQCLLKKLQNIKTFGKVIFFLILISLTQIAPLLNAALHNIIRKVWGLLLSLPFTVYSCLAY